MIVYYYIKAIHIGASQTESPGSMGSTGVYRSMLANELLTGVEVFFFWFLVYCVETFKPKVHITKVELIRFRTMTQL